MDASFGLTENRRRRNITVWMQVQAQARTCKLVTMQVECRTSMCRVQLMGASIQATGTLAAFHDLVRGFGLDVWRMNGFG